MLKDKKDKIEKVVKELIRIQKIPCKCDIKEGLEMVSFENALTRILELVEKEKKVTGTIVEIYLDNKKYYIFTEEQFKELTKPSPKSRGE